ncbi:hypothetical protein N9M16_04500 [Candidatus Dependentiae bacterium]|nr:hypothetical protein [Candidatus Dependentiae bacterium]
MSGSMLGNASKSNLSGYLRIVLEASLHILLTSARLWRVLKHCTWEKTTVATSRPGSKVGRYASSLRLPFLSSMVRRYEGAKVNEVKVTLSTAGYVQANDAFRFTAAPNAAGGAPMPSLGGAAGAAFEPAVLYSHTMTLRRV